MAKKHFEKSEMDELMDTKSGKQYEILYKLKGLNREAFLFMKQFGKRWKQKYHELWKTSYWREAKILLKEYFTIENGLICPICKLKINGNFTLHHEIDFYNSLNIFSPNFVNLIHNKCHTKAHKKSRKKRVS